jgi:tetratricopeptide (TPR) repeat protein
MDLVASIVRRFCLVLALLLIGGAPSLAKDAVVNMEDVPLLSSCEAGASVTAVLPEGQKVRLRFALAGAAAGCYSVSAEVDGGTVEGYVRKPQISGLEEFEKARQQASSQLMVQTAIRMVGLDLDQPKNPVRPAASLSANQRGVLMQAAARLEEGKPKEAELLLAQSDLPTDDRNAALLRSKALLQLARPRDALSVVNAALTTHSEDADLLAVAGLSWFQLDDVRTAKSYLKRSLSIEHNSWVKNVYEKVEREGQADVSANKSYGGRFVLRYEGGQLDPDTARKLTGVFEREITRISMELGCPFRERLVVILQSRENYKNTTGAADWSAGRYDGRIRLALPPNGTVGEEVRRTFSHETVHACLASLGRWPSWLHEGLAQKLSGAVSRPQGQQALRKLAEAKKLPKLADLAGPWARLSTEQALVAYELALSAAELFVERYKRYGVRSLMSNPQQLPQVTQELDRLLSDRYL